MLFWCGEKKRYERVFIVGVFFGSIWVTASTRLWDGWMHNWWKLYTVTSPKSGVINSRVYGTVLFVRHKSKFFFFFFGKSKIFIYLEDSEK